MSTHAAPRAGELLASRIRERIIRGELKPGDRLPPERSLMEEFSVSRSTFREAFRVLEAEGLVSVSRGVRKGAQIQLATVGNASRQLNLVMQVNRVTLDDVYQSLAIFEPAVVRVLARKATLKDIAALRLSVAQSRAALDDDAKYRELAGHFHRVLVERAGFKSLSLVADLLSDVVGSYVASASSSLPPSGDRANRLKALRFKEELVDLIEQHDADGAETHWSRYFRVTRKILHRWQPAKQK